MTVQACQINRYYNDKHNAGVGGGTRLPSGAAGHLVVVDRRARARTSGRPRRVDGAGD